ncbi:hypothetical protein PSTT_17036, partial [Puccinia striiformis]
SAQGRKGAWCPKCEGSRVALDKNIAHKPTDLIGARIPRAMDTSDASAPSPTSEPVEEFELRFRQLGQLVIDGFKRLQSKFWPSELDRNQATIYAPTSALPFHKIHLDSNEALSDELLSELLPLLASQLETLSPLLNQGNICMDPGSNLMCLLKLQPPLDYNMTRVDYYMALISPRPLHTSERVDDQQLKKFKSCRLNRLSSDFRELELMIDIICDSACSQIEGWNLCLVNESSEGEYWEWCWNQSTVALSTAETLLQAIQNNTDGGVYDQNGRALTTVWDLYEEDITDALGHINSVINLLSGSELVAAKGYWGWGMRGMTQQFSEAIASLGGSLDHWKLWQGHYGRQFVRQLVIHLTQLFITVMKLSRLFFQQAIGTSNQCETATTIYGNELETNQALV